MHFKKNLASSCSCFVWHKDCFDMEDACLWWKLTFNFIPTADYFFTEMMFISNNLISVEKGFKI